MDKYGRQKPMNSIGKIDGSDSIMEHWGGPVDPGYCSNYEADCYMSNGEMASGYSTPPFCTCVTTPMQTWNTNWEFGIGDCIFI